MTPTGPAYVVRHGRLMIGISSVLAFIGVAIEEIRVPVALVARLLSTQSNSGARIVARLAVGLRKSTNPVIARTSEVENEEEKCRY